MAKGSFNAIQYFGVLGIESKLIPLKSGDNNSISMLFILLEPYLINIEILQLPNEFRGTKFVNSHSET